MRTEPLDIARAAKEWMSIALTLLILDIFWLGFLARDFYLEHVGHLMRPDADKLAAGLFYLFYVTVIWVTSVRVSEDRTQAWQRGASLGFICYGVYELTNWAVLKGWSPAVVPVDWIWGILLTGTAACAGRAASSHTNIESETHLV